MKYETKEESQKDHINNYRSDGISKGKGQRYSSDYLRVQYILNNVPKKADVLDVGCNGGTIAVKLNQLGCYVRGIDIVPELVKSAVNRGVSAKIGEAEKLDYPDNYFDCVICSEVLEHLFDPLPAINEAYRVLKPGGKYIVTVPHPAGIMCSEGLGDYHQTNFTIEILDTLFYQKFKRGKVFFTELPYLKEYCLANGLNPNQPQWLGLVAEK